MALTPEDVRNKRFTPVRLREGYDMGEVDQFLDEVETQLERLTGEVTDLRGQVGTTPGAGDGAGPPPFDEASEPETGPPPEPAAVAMAVPPASLGEASNAAARLLEIAARNSDEVVTEAKEQAAIIIGEARTEAERLEQEAHAHADRLESDARGRAEVLDGEAADRRQQMFGELEREREVLAGEVANLQAYEREYRSRLRNYFEAQLAQLGTDPPTPPALPADEDENGSSLRALLSEQHNKL